MTPFKVRKLAGAVGAEITGLNLAAGADASLIAALRATWLEHGLIVMRNQPLPPADFQKLAERFGEVMEYPFVQGLEGHPLITPILKLPHERHNFGGVWHTDTAYLEEPPMATMLIVVSVVGVAMLLRMYFPQRAGAPEPPSAPNVREQAR